MALLAIGAVFLLLVVLALLGALMMPLCPQERCGFEDFDLTDVHEAEGLVNGPDKGLWGSCEAQAPEVAGAVLRLRGEGLGRVREHGVELSAAPQPSLSDDG